MPVTVKELIVVLCIAGVAFWAGRPIVLRFCSAADFARRRGVWLGLTAVAFLSPNFWIFAACAVPTLIWAGRRDRNPLALYVLLLQVIPAISIPIPAIGISSVFNLDMYRLLSLFVLIPCAWRIHHAATGRQRLGAMDYLLFASGVLQVLFYVRPDSTSVAFQHDSLTNAIRRGFLFLVDVYAIYYVASRSCRSRAQLREVLAMFCMSCVIMALIGVFEVLKSWLLYSDLITRWSATTPLSYYVFRGALLRAMASSGHPLALGYLLAIALGCWLYLKRSVAAPQRLLVTGVLCVGLFVTFSRGPWLGALVVLLSWLGLRTSSRSRLLWTCGIAVLVLGAMAALPIAESLDKSSITYRQRVILQAIDIIRQHPLFGDQFYYSQLHDLRQGQGIIDIVNTYVQVALSYGLVGLTCFLGFILLALRGLLRLFRRARRLDPDLAALCACLAACIIGTLIMIGTCSFIGGYRQMFYAFAGLAAACVRLPRRSAERPLPASAAATAGAPAYPRLRGRLPQPAPHPLGRH